MRMKLADYDSLAVFRTDFELICRNAMTYNTVDTIYYKSADKLLRYGQKFFSVEKLRSMKTHLAFASVIPDECLGKFFVYHLYSPLSPNDFKFLFSIYQKKLILALFYHDICVW